MRPLFPLSALLLVVFTATSASAQAGPVSELWNEWTAVEAEWRTERSGYASERQRQRTIRLAAAEGRDPRDRPVGRPPRPAGPQREGSP